MRLAACVILARDVPGNGIEVFMVRRSGRSAFAPDAFVFPGGTVDDADFGGAEDGWPDARVAAEFRATVDRILPASEPPVAPDQARALVRAAVRELKEEAAIDVSGADLALFSHWITPEVEPRRYNTYFFVARSPEGAEGVADAGETLEARWIAPEEALHHHGYGTFHLVYPTIKHLERLKTFDSVDGLLRFARGKDIVTIMPDRTPEQGFELPATLERVW